MFLQSFVAPILTYDVKEGRNLALNLMGTGFFVGRGILITAAHVLRNGSAEVAAGKAKGICVSPRVPNKDGGETDLFINLPDYDVAESPFDVAVAKTSYGYVSDRLLQPVDVSIADHISALGYPESAFQKFDGTLYIQARVHRGYVQRIVPRDRLVVGQRNPTMFELDFAITKGMSGSPLIYNTGSGEAVVGVCVGSITSRLVDYATTTVEDDGSTFKEVQQKVEEYGIAHDLTSLLDWRPRVLNGSTLEEASLDLKD